MSIIQGLSSQGPWCWNWSFMDMGSWMGFWWILPILILAGFYFIIVPRMRNDYTQEDTAKAIARMRYARGEISKDEYDEILRNL
jgi:uncharacterized membrane protein